MNDNMQKGLKCPPKFRITIIGLGLIGGSLALALRGFNDAAITGVDINACTREEALACGAVDAVYEDASEAVKDADLIIMCVYPHHILNIIHDNKENFKKGAVLTDVCGAKTCLYQQITPLLPPDVDYLGIHPMAGKEVDGFANADKDLFRNTGLIITPLPGSKEKSIKLLQELAAYIGATYIATSDTANHDEIIAYTSDLMHIAAACLCIDFHPLMNRAFTAGAFRDCTRIANINPSLWTELLLSNGKQILPHLDKYIANLQKMRTAIKEHDERILYELLERAGNNKREMLQR